jgi:hypothetical protein
MKGIVSYIMYIIFAIIGIAMVPVMLPFIGVWSILVCPLIMAGLMYGWAHFINTDD